MENVASVSQIAAQSKDAAHSTSWEMYFSAHQMTNYFGFYNICKEEYKGLQSHTGNDSMVEKWHQKILEICNQTRVCQKK